MLDDPRITDSMSLPDLVPEVYARFRPLVVDALSFFVAQLPAERKRTITASLAALPVGATPAQRLVALVRECPVLHKLAQVLARHPELDTGLRGQLQRLEMLEPSTPFEEIASLICTELADKADEFVIDVEAAASPAVSTTRCTEASSS